MKLLRAPRFHIMSQDEINESIRKIWAEIRISELSKELNDIQNELWSMKDYRDKMHDAGIYSKSFFEGRMRDYALEMYYQ